MDDFQLSHPVGSLEVNASKAVWSPQRLMHGRGCRALRLDHEEVIMVPSGSQAGFWIFKPAFLYSGLQGKRERKSSLLAAWHSLESSFVFVVWRDGAGFFP